jgi:hypothetical protein
LAATRWLGDPWARSGPETEGPEVHNLRCSNVPVANATAFAGVLALGQRLCSDDPALGARLRRAAWIDFHKLDPGTCLVVEHCGQLRPRGVVNMFRQHAVGEALDVEIFDPHARRMANVNGDLKKGRACRCRLKPAVPGA